MVNAGEVELDEQLAEEAKSIVALAFRNGPIEDIHAGRECPTCAGKAEYSHITQDEMKRDDETRGGQDLRTAVDSGIPSETVRRSGARWECLHAWMGPTGTH